MTPSYKRAKAKLLVEWVAERLRLLFPEYGPTDIIVPKTSDKGEDLHFSRLFAQHIGTSYEMKSQKGYAHVYTDMDQTVKNCKGRVPVLVVKAPYQDPLVIMRWVDYERTLE